MPQLLVANIAGDTARIRSARRPLHGSEMCHSISIEYDPPAGLEILWGIQSTTDPAVLPAGASLIGGYLADGGIPTISRQIDLESNTSTISSPSFVFADIDGGVSDDLARKFANFNTGRHAIVRYYVHPPGVALDLLEHLDGTFVMTAPTWHKGAMTIACSDIQREASDTKCMVPHSWKLVGSLSNNGGNAGPPLSGFVSYDAFGETSTSHVYLYGDTDPADVVFEHSTAYPEQPGETVFYVSVGEGEAICLAPGPTVTISGVQVWKCPVIARGVFQTKVAAVVVDQDGDTYTVDNLPDAEEVIYLNEPGSSMLSAALTRSTLDGRVVPEHVFKGLDAFQRTVADAQDLIDNRLRWVDVLSLQGIDLEFPLVFRNPGEAKLLDFIERQILGPMDGLLVPNRLGQLSFRAIPELTPDAGYVGLLSDNYSNIVTANIGPLQLITEGRKDPIKVLSGWDWEAEVNRDQPTFYRPEVAEYVNGDIAELVLEYRGLATGYQSDAQRHELARKKAALHSLPVLEITVPSVLALTQYEVGDVVRLETDKVRNAFAGLPYHIDTGRSFAIVSTSRDNVRGGISYGLQGSTGTPGSVADSQLEQHLPDSWYDQFPRFLDALSRPGGLQITGSTITGSGYSIDPGWYRLDTDLIIGPSFSCGFRNPGAMFVLCGKGSITIQAADPWNSKGMGIHAPGAGETATSAPTAGQAGYVGGSSPGQGIDFRAIYRRGTEINSDGDYRLYDIGRARCAVHAASPVTGGRHIGAAPILALAVNNGELQGIPADMSGSGGAGARAHRRALDSRVGDILNTGSAQGTLVYSLLENGFDGGRGGISIGYIARNIAFSGAGGTVCDGGNAGGAVNAAEFVGAPGQPGWPGVGFALVDGGVHKSLPPASRFSCRVGRARALGVAVSTEDWIETDPDATPTFGVRAVDLPLNDVDLWQSMTLVQHVPPPAQLREGNRSVSSIAQLFDLQRDGLIKVHVGARPSDSGLGDLWITQTQLDADTFEPYCEIRVESGWRQFVWGSEEFEHIYAGWIAYARRYGSTEIIYAAERPASAPAGTIWIDSRTGAEWLLQEPPTPDVLLRVPGVGAVGENLLSDLNLAGEGQGVSSYVFTRDADLQPVSALDVAVQEIAAAFIALGALEGEYEVKADDDSLASITVPPPASFSPAAVSSSSIRVSWTPPPDLTYVDTFEVMLNGFVVDEVTGSPYVIGGLPSNTTQLVGIRSRYNGTDPATYSVQLSSSVATPSDAETPGAITGITLEDTGRRIAGVARQNGTTTLIATGRQMTLTLNNGVQFLTSVQSNGAFEYNVPTAADDQLGLTASLYTNNGDDSTAASLEFIYEL